MTVANGDSVNAGRMGGVAAAGIIALASDQSIEDELHLLLDENGVSLFFTRVPFEDRFDLSTLGAVAEHLAGGTRTLPPGDAVDVMVYGCTSGTVAAGERMIVERLATHRPGKRSTNPLTAAKAALRHLSAERIGLLTPYPRDVHSAFVHALAVEFELVRTRCLGIDVDGEISRVSPDAILDASRPLAVDVDAVFLSCTSLRLARSIDRFEAELGVPVVTSNQALAWHILQLVGRRADMPFGALMSRPAAKDRTQSREGSRSVR